MLDEFVIVPDVFDSGSYKHPDACDSSLRWLKLALLESGIVRDLRDGDWSKFCVEHAAELHQSTKELLKKLRSNNRLRSFDAQLEAAPTDPGGWLEEGLASAAIEPVVGLVAAHASASRTRDERVGSIETLPSVNWWRNRSPSRLLARSNAGHLEALGPILRQARSLMFIDPNLDPAKGNYRRFEELLMPLRNRRDPPLVELHRSSALGDGPERSFPAPDEWRQRFDTLHQRLVTAGLGAEVFLWVDFHDRFLVSDLIGLNTSAGFDVTGDPRQTVTWTRLGIVDKEKVQRDFDPSVRADALRCRFQIGINA